VSSESTGAKNLLQGDDNGHLGEHDENTCSLGLLFSKVLVVIVPGRTTPIPKPVHASDMFSLLLPGSSSSTYLKMAAGIHPGAPADDFYNDMGGVFPQRLLPLLLKRMPSPRSGGMVLRSWAGAQDRSAAAFKHRLRALGLSVCALGRHRRTRRHMATCNPLS
jgi:hypothetical protein